MEYMPNIIIAITTPLITSKSLIQKVRDLKVGNKELLEGKSCSRGHYSLSVTKQICGLWTMKVLSQWLQERIIGREEERESPTH